MAVKVYTKEITFGTTKNRELVNVTEYVQKALAESKIKNGTLLVFAPHATGAIIVDEDESGLKQDILEALGRLIPEQGNYNHNRIDDNAPAHLKSTLLGSSKVIPVSAGKIALGTWQSIFFLESDGPRSARKASITIIGE
jgi:secondary thiamine-phosphate synthase enzyme